jgi:transcriptional regulator with XRE-family HTH domain
MTSRGETGACLRALRALRGWSQRQAAAAACLSPTRLSDYESGKTSPTLDRLEAIVTTLGFPMLSFEIARPPGPARIAASPRSCRGRCHRRRRSATLPQQ